MPHLSNPQSKIKVAEAELATMEKLGMATGVTRSTRSPGQVPIWVANFVLMSYGSGAVMSVPGHDQRDQEFASKYGLPIVQVIATAGERHYDADLAGLVRRQEGRTVNSAEFDGLDFESAFDAIADRLETQGKGKRTVNYPPARLGRLPPALLGRTHPHHQLRQLRRSAGAGEGPAGGSAHRGGLRGCGLADQEHAGVLPDQLPRLRRRRHAGNRHFRHLHGILLVLRPLCLRRQ